MMRKLEIGSRERIDNSWETLDIMDGEGVDIVADISKKLPIQSYTYDLVYTSHTLEHINWYEVESVLREIHRIIKRGGSLEVFVPDIDKIITAYQRKEIPDKWYKYNEQADPFVWFIGRLYTHGKRPSDFHRGAFNQEYLTKLLKRVGFSTIKRITKPRGFDHGYINMGLKAIK